MARIAVIDGTTVVNVIEADPDFVLDGYTLVASDEAGPGWAYVKSKFTALAAPPEPVPVSVSNFQARAVMRKYPMADGRSLFTTVDTDLRAAVTAAAGKPEFDPARVSADLNWQAWEQANDYDRNGAITRLLAKQYGFDDPTTDALFRQAKTVTA